MLATGTTGWVVILTLGFARLGGIASAGDELASAVMARSRALQGLALNSDDAALQKFIDEQLCAALVTRTARADLIARLQEVGQAAARAGRILIEAAGDDGMRILLHADEGGRAVTFHVERAAPYRITEIVISALPSLPPGRRANGPPITWDSLEDSLRAAEQSGFSGTVLIVKDDQIVLHEGYGLASRDASTRNSPDTIFAIGSTPIDFTRAAILKLEDLHLLQTSDPINKFLTDVPEDKRAITIDHLMTGRSGLKNFHGDPSVDTDHDLTWIDRQTALKRILGGKLLFRPGEGEAHSHSAWGLLAAIVEIVSHQTYEQFLAQHFFGPAGMKRTGDHHFAAQCDDDELAVGYGTHQVGEPNNPAHWGETSWLVKGSGGMVSNAGDLYRWVSAIRSGGLLSAPAQKKYFGGGGGPLVGGDERGFLCFYSQDPGGMMFLCSNAHRMQGDAAEQLAERLFELVSARRNRNAKKGA